MTIGSRDNIDLPEFSLKIAVTAGVFVSVSVEVLSAAGALSRPAIAIAWCAAAALCAWYFFRRVSGIRLPAVTGAWLPFLVVLPGTLLIALVSPPNNWDSMSYHLARTSHWIANQSTAHFPTNMPSQNVMPPWVEYAIMHLRLLMGSDRLVNLVQWLAFGGAMLAVSVLARALTGDRTLAWLAAVVVATTPMNILQASSTQNDLACAFWGATFAGFLFLALRHRAGAEIWSGIAFALGTATKYTAAQFLAPLLLVGIVALFRQRGVRTACRFAGACAVAGALLLGPHLWRNYRTYGDPAGDPNFVGEHRNQAPLLEGAGSTAMRYLALQFATPWPTANGTIEGWVASAHRLAGSDAGDPRTSFTAWRIPGLSAHEDETPNLILTCVLLAAYPFVLARRGRLRVYSGCVLAGFILFSALVKWQVWGSRFLVVFFVLSAVPAAALLRRYSRAAATVLTICAVPWVLFCTSRPLIPNGRLPSILAASRGDLYFTNRWQEREAFFELADRLRALPCRTVGLDADADSWEYPLWELTEGSSIRFRHLFVANPSAKLEEPGVGEPCAVVSQRAGPDRDVRLAGLGFTVTWTKGRVALATKP